MRRALALTLLLTTLTAPALGQDIGTPAGWLFGGDYDQYEVGAEVLPRMKPGTQTAYIKGIAGAECGNYGALFQTIAADKYRGKRLKFSARLFEQDLRGGTFNMFVFLRGPDGAGRVFRPLLPPGENANFHNETVTVAVPADAQDITFGFRLTGPGGTGWADAVRLEVMGDNFSSARAARGPQRLSWALDDRFHGHFCALRRSWLTSRGLYDRDERSLTTLAHRPAPQGVQAALSAQ
jgi:hypothetical protein